MVLWRGGDLVTLACDAAVHALQWSSHLIHRGHIFAYSPPLYILLVLCPVERFLGFFELWENTYSSAIYFLVGGTVCSYVCIQESTLQCSVSMSCVCSYVCIQKFRLFRCCYALTCVCSPSSAAATAMCTCVLWVLGPSYHVGKLPKQKYSKSSSNQETIE